MTSVHAEHLDELWDRVVYQAGERSHVPLTDIYDPLEDRAYGLMLLVPALVVASPLSLIPGVAWTAALLILVVAVQAMLGRSSPWVPGWLLELALPQARLDALDRRLRPWLAWSGRFVGPRLSVLVKPPMFQQLAVGCALLAFSFYPLALIPLAVTGPALAVACFAIALAARDGAFVICGGLVIAATIVLAVYWWG